MQTVMAIANQKGGVGKTTTTINLASSLAHRGKQVLVVDLDPQANTTSGLGLAKHQQPSSYEVMFDGEIIKQAIIECHGISVLPARPELAGAEVELVNEFNRERRLEQALNHTAFDFVLVDCPPSLGLLTVNALTAAQTILIPVQAEYYALEGLSQLVDTIGRVRAALNPRLTIAGLLLTMVDERTALSKQVRDQLQQHFGGMVFDTVIPRNVRVAEAPSYGQPVMAYDKWSKGARNYKQLAKEVLHRVQS